MPRKLNLDLSTTYFGRVNTTRTNKIKAEETLLISEQGYTVGKTSGQNRMSDIIGYRS